ncbi:helix-turn-helix transcriptional regulator [Streptomyces winkii]|uniref:helix-turn-helix transcriptional regulator n=1 Tax=Streptomyces winkii TaxID=3051178 RepID=UPI0028D7BE4B|nr:LuxR C-terminal-related transcriptional regulator [Streptomyces sp. DSM 40971]
MDGGTANSRTRRQRERRESPFAVSVSISAHLARTGPPICQQCESSSPGMVSPSSRSVRCRGDRGRPTPRGERSVGRPQDGSVEERDTPPGLAGAFGTNTRSDRPRLSRRERDVLIEWFQSESKELVARKLGIQARTVSTYLDRVRIKYANAGRVARTKTNLVARAIEDRLIGPEDL